MPQCEFVICILIRILFYCTDGEKPKNVSNKVFSKLAKADSEIALHFGDLHKINTGRVMKRQISMLHITSGIQCVIAFEKDHCSIESTKIISRFVTDPLCKCLFINGKVFQS